jgi:serine/threonine protein kinase
LLNSRNDEKMTLTGINGTVYRLDSTPIGSGGEGDIYNVLGMDYVAKIYKSGVLSRDVEEKLKIMVERPPNASVLSQVAWPLDMVYGNGLCRGFIMPKLNINAELGEIYKYPSSLPISAHQKVNIAKNICVVISEVHQAGYVFGDFNPRNIGLDVNTGLVSFLDTDTYHVVDRISGNTYRCNVCAPGYAAPELLNKCSDYIAANPSVSKNAYAQTPLPTFTKQTDNFALAIHIFKLLMNGYTPFGGIIETASVSQASPGVGDAAVRRDSYCFKPGYKHQSAAILPLEVFPQEISDLFTRAFIIGKANPQQRPSAAEWYNALVGYEKKLVTCINNSMHHYDEKNEICPLCEADKRFGNVLSGGSINNPMKQDTYAPPPRQAKRQPIQPSSVPTTPPPVLNNWQTPKPPQQSTTTSSGTKGWKAAAILLSSVIVISGMVMLYNRSTPDSSFISYTQPPVTEQPPTPTPTPTPTPSQRLTVSIGDIIPFGGHDWRVLDVQGNYTLILTENVIENRRYHNTVTTWENSEIRRYLNGDFFNNFTQTDRDRIRETYVINNDNPWTFQRGVNVPGGNNTTDRIFLLSIDEVVQYFGGSDLLELGKNESNRNGSVAGLHFWGIWEDNEISRARIARNAASLVWWWWLRSPGNSDIIAAHVFTDGSVRVRGGHGIYNGSGGVRPALWLNLESFNP